MAPDPTSALCGRVQISLSPSAMVGTVGLTNNLDLNPECGGGRSSGAEAPCQLLLDRAIGWPLNPDLLHNCGTPL